MRAALCFRVDTTTVSALTIRGSELPDAPLDFADLVLGMEWGVWGFPEAVVIVLAKQLHLHVCIQPNNLAGFMTNA